MSEPAFVVVGHVNKGKSTIVSTLTENDAIRIDEKPGTTKELRRVEARAGNRTHFVVIDTPGFQDAPAAFAWMRARSRSAADRPQTVAAFVKAHRDTGEFEDECELLRPVLAGASILYVADGNVPFLKDYEDELEILRWTGRPGIALLNPIQKHPEAEANAARWRTALEQYFKRVLDFNGHLAGIRERLELLGAFRELRPEWKAPLDEAIEAFRKDWERRRRRSAEIIADLVAGGVRHAVEGAPDEAALRARWQDALRAEEARARRQVEDLYAHHESVREPALEPPPAEQDLFSEKSWKVFGLSPKQLLLAGAAGGAVTGGWIDAHLGGASMGAGLLVGGLAGGLLALGRTKARLPTLRGLVDALRGRKVWTYGPHPNPKFFWILLDRALDHHRSVRTWSHGRREIPDVQSVVRQLDRKDVAPFDAAASILRSRELKPEEREAFVQAVDRVLTN